MIREHLESFDLACALPDDRPIADWCADHVNLPASYVPPGFFKPQKSRWLLPIFDALKSDKYRVVNILKPTGTGGTLVADLFVAWRIVNKPGNIQWNWNSEALAKSHVEERVNPLFDSCKPIADLTSGDRHEVRTMSRKFKNGTWFRIQAGTESRLQGKHIPVQVNDEVWQWDAGRMREADSRLGAYRRVGMSKQLNISQGGDTSTEWFKRCMECERFEWHVPCESCGHLFFPQMETRKGREVFYMATFKGDESGVSDVAIHCPSCKHEMRESDRLKAFWNESGKMVQVNAPVQSEAVTFRWSPFVLTPWKEIALEYVRALAAKKQGVLFPLRQFVQKVMADFWDETQQEVEVVDLRTEDYKPSELWSVEHRAYMTVDCQRNLTLFYAVIRGWATNGESRRLWRGRVNTFSELEAVQKRFGVKSTHVGLDVGYEQTQVMQEAARHIDENCKWGWIGLKGIKDDQGQGFEHIVNKEKSRRLFASPIYPDLELGQRNHNVSQWLASLSATSQRLYAQNDLRIPVILWSNRLAYDILSRLRDGRGAVWLCPSEEAAQDEEKFYREQMSAKVFKTEPDSRGNPTNIWVNVKPNFPDHYWDCESMQVVFAAMGGNLIGV